LTILYSMVVVLLEALLDLSVPQSVMIRQTRTNMAARAWRLSIRVKITMLWQVVRWHGAVTTPEIGREEKPTSGRHSTPGMPLHSAT